MINTFIVKSCTERNELQIILDGFFMKSELELAVHLAKRESEKLKKGFEVKLNLRNFHSSEYIVETYLIKMKKILSLAGCGSFNYIGYAPARLAIEIGGFYPYENEWFF